MGEKLKQRGRLFDVGEAETPVGRALLQERYKALQRQIPLLYLIALANFIGLAVAGGTPAFDLFHPANLLLLFIVARLLHWVRTRKRRLPPERILGELRRTLILAAVLSLGFGYWAIALFSLGNGEQKELVILFATLAAIGCAYGLSSFPAAARLPLLLFALPLAGRLLVSPVPVHVAVGVSLALVTLLVLRLLNLQNHAFAELVRSRSTVESERERAQRAEQTALAEKARVRQVADTDSLTGLANRRAFLAELEARLAPGTGGSFALALIDLDGFKPINDTFGHAAGDSVLIEVSERLRRECGPGALAARIGGDEFALIVPCGDKPAAVRAGERACAAIGEAYKVNGREFRISACCGLILLRPGGADVAKALTRADAALYCGKQQGRGCVAMFTPRIEHANRRRVAIERALREPAVQESIVLAYQPIFALDGGGLAAFEALARWSHEELGPVPPSEFIPIAEQIHVIEGISDRLLARAAAEARNWPDSVALSFNLSAVQLCSGSAAATVLDIVGRAGLDPARLRVEVTETALLADFATARANLQALRAAGVRIVLDDFGAGFASISYLREIDFDGIKLDGSLITGAAEAPSAMRLLKGVLDLCASLRVPCVAEHIEDEAQRALLTRLGCGFGQGFVLSPPLEPAAAASLAASRIMPFPAAGRSRARRAA